MYIRNSRGLHLRPELNTRRQDQDSCLKDKFYHEQLHYDMCFNNSGNRSLTTRGLMKGIMMLKV